MDLDLDIFSNFNVTNNRLAPVPEEGTEEILKAIENFPIIGENFFFLRFLLHLILFK